MSILTKIKQNLINISGWHTKRKIIIFESDDWGMIRMASKESYNGLLKKGYPLDSCPYSTNDSLERETDVEALLNVLSSHKNYQGKNPVFTINNVVANPKFIKIRDSNFSEYYRESFVETYAKYPGSENILSLWKEGISTNLVQPQYHATEHLNVNRWMKALESNTNKIVNDAFNENMFSLHAYKPASCRDEFLDAFGLGHEEEYETISSIVNDGLDLFENVWGFRSNSFIAPCYIWPESLESILHDMGVKYIQGTHVQRNAINGIKKKFTKKYHFTGNRNKWSQLYLVRNVFFEPTDNLDKDWVNSSLSEIEIAFRFKKPVIISSHRVNYMGRLNPSNRDRGLKLLDELLKKILMKWPDVEFMSTDQLGNLIAKKE